MLRRTKRLPRQTEISDTRRYIVMVAFALGAFGIGTTEFASMGLLPLIAHDFGISEAKAGTVISVYALGVMVGSPMVALFTGFMPRRRLLLLLMAAFTVSHAVTVFSSSYAMLLITRFVAGLPHGAYFSITALATASMAPAGQRGRSIAYVGMGFSVATVAGVPAAQALGSAFGWQIAYALVAAVGLITLVALWFLMPHMTEMPPTSPRTELGALGKAQIWLTLLIGTIGFGGNFAVYTYITWTMTERAGLNPHWMWLVLMVYGFGQLLGNVIGGRLSDWNLEKGIMGALSASAILMTLFYLASQNVWTAVPVFVLIGTAASALVPILQIRLMDNAGDAQMLAASLNHTALNTANALGAALGGVVIGAGFSYAAPALAGAGLAVLGVCTWAFAYHLKRSQAREEASTSASS
ncbi:Inner membrane transport protein YdhP [Corynebacterium ciconiae DSM 44920]|uniref:MFS transporter n=1 Tax=Corynebacterium ciconiae TaxID=227319 RepID=UPI000373B150|nr:MFS transporter [Corynebacterium ciconiae]WKD61866.1 Inner membrane transport protein YdhP [Corynebacterium ciconiae DSM 44920]